MIQDSTQNSGGKPVVLSVVMLAVLLACVALAWWISSIRQGYTDQGVRIIQQIQKAGLSAYWKGAEEAYYIIQEKGRPSGYAAELRSPRPGGGFDGLSIHVRIVGNRRAVQAERWQLDNTAKRGWFQIRVMSENTPVIQMQDGVLLNPDDEDPRTNRVETAANYLPEDILSIAAAVVAREKTQAFFKSVYLSDKNMDRSLLSNIGLTNLVYKGRRAVTVVGKRVEADEVEVRLGVLGRERVQTIFLAPEGRVVQVAYQNQIVTAQASIEEITQVDAEARAILDHFADEYRMPRLGQYRGLGK